MRLLALDDLRAGMVLAEDLYSSAGIVYLAKGVELTG